jgi:flavodoxin
MDKKIMLAYFSAAGHTRRIAQALADKLAIDCIEIKPVIPYSPSDLDWYDPNSRTFREMQNEKIKPAMQPIRADLSSFDILFLGFPVWWYTYPRIVGVFLDLLNLKGKIIVPFATSDGSDITSCARNLEKNYHEAIIHPGRILSGNLNRELLNEWLSDLGLSF